MSWIQLFLRETERAEAPTSYFYWSALSVLSAVVGRRVYIKKEGLYNLYPNIFVFLISKLSGLGKGFPISVASKLVHKLEFNRIIEGQASIEGIIKELSKLYTTPSGRVINTAEAFLIGGEFGSFLLENPRLFTQLTDLYDSIYHDEWDKTLSTQDKKKLKEICLTGLFAANETHFNEALPMHAKKGGFLGRVQCIYESRTRQLNPALRKTGKPEIDYNKLLEHLKELTKVSGEFTIEDSAIKLYEDWYTPFYLSENSDDTGTTARAKDTILKVAMLISLSERTDLILTEGHMGEAMLNTVQTLNSTRTMIIGEGKAEKAREAKIILQLLACTPDYTLSRRQLLVRGFGNFDVNDLDRVMNTFEQGKLVKVWGSGKDIMYKLTDSAIGLLVKFEKEDEK